MSELVIREVMGRLSAHFGSQHWWPARTPFEVVVGAILTQNTAWKNVVLGIEALRARGLLELSALAEVPEEVLAPLIRPTGYYNQKAKKLKAFCTHLANGWNLDLDAFFAQETEELRRDLLSIRGVGRETADSIVLYAAGKPSFVVDAYTHRVFSRHGWISEEADYEEIRAWFMDSLPEDVSLFQELHALIVRAGHTFCRPRPLCAACPLAALLDGEPAH